MGALFAYVGKRDQSSHRPAVIIAVEQTAPRGNAARGPCDLMQMGRQSPPISRFCLRQNAWTPQERRRAGGPGKKEDALLGALFAYVGKRDQSSHRPAVIIAME